MPEARGLWTNWAGNQRCAPAAVEHPAAENDLVALVKGAAATGRTVKVVGAGHSFTDIACTDGVLVHLDRYGRVLSADPGTGRVTVQAGMPITVLNEELAARGLAMPNLGDIAYQTIAGAISTATHGTGRKLGNLSTQVVALELVTADGSIVRASADEEPEVFDAARVGLDALGILSTVTLRCVPAFNLHAEERPRRFDYLLEHLDELVDDNDHFEFFYVPHTGGALTKRNNVTDEPARPRPRLRYWTDKVLMENAVFAALCRVGRVRPSLIPRLNKLPIGGRRSDYVEPSHRVFASPRFVHFVEMEYAIPRSNAVTALRRLKGFIDSSGLNISFPIEVRFVAADDLPLSPAQGRDTCYIAVHVYRGMPYEQYFRGVEAIATELGGRPHWGKLHYQTAATLPPRYPGWERFRAVRARLDPEGRFRNAYLDRVLGPPS